MKGNESCYEFNFGVIEFDDDPVFIGVILYNFFFVPFTEEKFIKLALGKSAALFDCLRF